MNYRETAFVGFSQQQSGWSANVLPTFLVGYSTTFSVFLYSLAIPLLSTSHLVFSDVSPRDQRDPQLHITTARIYYLFFHAIRVSFVISLTLWKHQKHFFLSFKILTIENQHHYFFLNGNYRSIIELDIRNTSEWIV